MQKQSRAVKTSGLMCCRHKPRIGLSSSLLSQRQVVAAASFLDAGASGSQSSLTWLIVPLSPLLPARMGQVNMSEGAQKVHTTTPTLE